MLRDMEAQPLTTNWASCTRDLLCRLGFMEFWESECVGNIEAFLGIFKLRVRGIFTSHKNGILDWKTKQEQDAI